MPLVRSGKSSPRYSSAKTSLSRRITKLWHLDRPWSIPAKNMLRASQRRHRIPQTVHPNRFTLSSPLLANRTDDSNSRAIRSCGSTATILIAPKRPSALLCQSAQSHCRRLSKSLHLLCGAHDFPRHGRNNDYGLSQWEIVGNRQVNLRRHAVRYQRIEPSHSTASQGHSGFARLQIYNT